MTSPSLSHFTALWLRIAVFALIVLSCSGTTTPPVAAEPKEVVCFIYHRFGDSRYPSTNTPVADFDAHLAYLTKQGYQVLNFSDAIDYINSDKPAKKTAVITIDDGYKSFFTHGLPILKKYKLPATLFINTKSVSNGKDLMTWDDVKASMKSNVEIGNHTHSHAYFLNEPAATRYETFKNEIDQSQAIIKERLGITAKAFSYPYGEFDFKMKTIAEEAGFKAAAAQRSGVLYTGMDLFQCPRFPMSEAYSAKSKFIEKARMSALKITEQTPQDFILPPTKQPILKLTFDPTDLRVDQLQCFIQGSKCNLTVLDKSKATVTLQATTPITRRRTLYTITVQDKSGTWHWYSHLWINPEVAGQD